MLYVLIALLACSGDDPGKTDDTDAVHSTDGPTGDTAAIDTAPLALNIDIDLPDDTSVHFTRVASVTSPVPTRATLTIDDGEQVREMVFADLATAHELPLLGLLAEVPHQIDVVLLADDGQRFSGSISVQIDTPNVLLPSTSITGAGSPAAGWTLVGLGITENVVAIYDEQGRPRWARSIVDDVKGARFTDQGVLGFKVGFGLTTMGLLGENRTVYHADDQGPGWVQVTPELFHHDMHVLDDGTLLGLSKLSRDVTDLPSDYAFSGVTAETITDDQIVHFAADGTVLTQWSTVELLSTTRISWDSLDPGPSGDIDWGHTNSVSFPDDDTVLISVRHQDALVAFERSTGDVRWILANPDGWPPALDALRLQPLGAVAWPYHQHGPQLSGDLLTVFDNGNNARTTPYTQVPDPRGTYSRVVQYRIDETLGTVEEVFSFILGDDGVRGLYSGTMGDADMLPGGHILATWANVSMQEDGSNVANGRGSTSSRVVELDPSTGEVIWDLSLYSDGATHPKGWRCDQADRVGSLYAGIATERILP